MRKSGAEGKNQDIPHKQQFQESDEDDIAVSHTVNWNRNTTENLAENVSVWRNSLLNDAGGITFQDLPVQLVPDDINTAYQYFIMLANDSLPY